MAKGKKRQVRSKTNEKKIKTVEEENLKIQDKIFVVFCIIMFFAAFYVLTLYITHKNSDSNNENEEVEAAISYNEIIFGRSLAIDEKEYYVIYYDSSDEEVTSTCNELVNNFRDSSGASVYYVDMHNPFNSGYATTEETNKSPNSIEELKINGPTVIKVSKKKVVEYIEGLNNVRDYLQ